MKEHLTLTDRAKIEMRLAQNHSLRSIAIELKKSPSTISREIRRHRIQTKFQTFVPAAHATNNCVFRMTCKITGLCSLGTCTSKLCAKCNLGCNSRCSKFEKGSCIRLRKAPYVCNGCSNYRKCILTKWRYDANDAHKAYLGSLTETRKGFNLTEDELKAIEELVTPRIKQGHSVYSIIHANKNDNLCSESTLYRLVNANVLGARRIDMPRAVRFKKRNGNKIELKIDKKCREGRTYHDYLEYCKQHPDLSTTEMDSVEGRKGGKVLLTMMFDNCSFMLAFIRERNTAQSVIDIFNDLYTKLAKDVYGKLFGLLLTDNGSEFSNPMAIETEEVTGVIRSKVYYCDPSSPYEKPLVENNHEMIRRILPKGSSFDLLEQSDIDRMMSHINSYGRPKYNGMSPAELFVQMYGEDVLHLLRQEIIPPDNIVLKPSLMK